MSKPASVFFTGMDSSDAEQLIALFHDINRRTGNRWSLAANADSATALVIDVDTLYGHMTWLRAQSAEHAVVALTAGTSAEADHVLHRPVTPDAMRRLLMELADGTSAPARETPAPAAATPEPVRAPAAPEQVPSAREVPPAEQAAPAPAAQAAPAPAAPEPELPAEPAAPPAPAKPVARKLIDLLLAGEIPAGPHTLELAGQPPLVLDVTQKTFLCGNSIKSFLPHAQATLEASAFQPVPANQYDTLRQSIGEAQPLGRLVWLAALGGSGGEISGAAPDARYRLTKWPQIEREFPKHFRIATTMMKGFQTPTELAAQSGSTLAEVNDFIAASLVSGYAETEAVASGDAPAPAQKSLLERLRGAR